MIPLQKRDRSARRRDHVRYDKLLTQAERNIEEIFNLNLDRYGKTKMRHLRNALWSMSRARSILDNCACEDLVPDPTAIYYGKNSASQKK